MRVSLATLVGEQIPQFKLEEALTILESVAKKFTETSVERGAIEMGAKALLFIHSSKQSRAFGEYLEHFDAELTEEQKRLLVKAGLR